MKKIFFIILIVSLLNIFINNVSSNSYAIENILHNSIDLNTMVISELFPNTDEKKSEIFVNYYEIKNLNKPQKPLYLLDNDTYNYVIISKSELYTIISATDFFSWKNTVGYNIRIVNVTDSEITSQPGIDLAEHIRNFLRYNYINWGIEYLLLVGDYATIPMRYCYPNPSNHINTAGIPGGNGGEVPTDYYYADLSSSDADSWDFDGDGYMGEYGEDKPDFLPEIYVGRIPVNDPMKILYTLEKTMIFEQDTNDWKKHALHGGAFFYFTKELGDGYPSMDGATSLAYIENDFMNEWTISHYSEQEGLEKSIYNWNPLNEEDFINDWRNGQYSIVSWNAHGWSHLAARKVWSSDNGNNIAEANEVEWPTLISTSSNLDDDYPSIVTAISCYVGYPEPNSWGNLGIDLLTKPSYGAAVGVISSARTPYGNFDWPSDPGGSDSIIYEFNRYLINNSEKVGEAFFDSKYFCNFNYNWGGWVEYNDLYTFNLYGDPSLSLYGINLVGKPAKPSKPIGLETGKIGENYAYTSSTIDPNNDKIFYMFDWGDTTSGWLGPYESGIICEANHTWTEKGSYEIKVIAKDINGLVSDWSDPIEVSMPKSKSYLGNMLQLFFKRIFQNFPFFEKILKLY